MNTKFLGLLAAVAFSGSVAATDFTNTSIIGTSKSETNSLRTTTGIATTVMEHFSDGEYMVTNAKTTTTDEYTAITAGYSETASSFDSMSQSYNGLRTTVGNSTSYTEVKSTTDVTGTMTVDSWTESLAGGLDDAGEFTGDWETTITEVFDTTPYSYVTELEQEYETITNYQRVD